jgi:integral membrane protein (TIGR01906 family)
LIVGTVVVGVVGLVAFDQLFETFHEVFFPAGSFLFDPATDKLVQLFPFEFWDETALVVGVVIIAAALAVAWAAARRARRSTATRPAHDLAIAPEPGS